MGVHVQRREQCTNHSNEAVLLSCVIYAMEKRDVCFVYLPGAFMQA